jgi:hypothetical protein
MVLQQALDDCDTDGDPMIDGQAIGNLLVGEIGPLDRGSHR